MSGSDSTPAQPVTPNVVDAVGYEHVPECHQRLLRCVCTYNRAPYGVPRLAQPVTPECDNCKDVGRVATDVVGRASPLTSYCFRMCPAALREIEHDETARKAAAQPVTEPEDARVLLVAQAIWHVDAPDSEVDWECAASRERYVCMARAVLQAYPLAALSAREPGADDRRAWTAALRQEYVPWATQQWEIDAEQAADQADEIIAYVIDTLPSVNVAAAPQAKTRGAGNVDDAFDQWFDGDFAKREERCDGIAVCMAMIADSLQARDISAVMRQAWHAALAAAPVAGAGERRHYDYPADVRESLQRPLPEGFESLWETGATANECVLYAVETGASPSVVKQIAAAFYAVGKGAAAPAPTSVVLEANGFTSASEIVTWVATVLREQACNASRADGALMRDIADGAESSLAALASRVEPEEAT